MKNFLKKATSILLVFVLFCTAVLVSPVSTKAAQNYVTILHKVSTAQGNVPINYNFSLNRKSDIFFIIRTNERTGVTVSVKEPGHDIPCATITLAETNPDWEYNRDNGIYQNTAKINLASGKYILEVTFDIGVNFDLAMNQLSPNPTLSKKTTTITKGFSETIKVNGGIIRSCSSSNKKVATVSNKGKINAKKNGKATIKVKLTNGSTLSCKVKVVSNQYKAKKINVDSTIFNTCDMKAYNAKFDAKGNLVVKFVIVNNSYGKITNIPKFKIKVKNNKKKTTVSYSKNSYIVTIPSYKEKACTVTIPKSCFKTGKDKIDIRTSSITISGRVANSSL